MKEGVLRSCKSREKTITKGGAGRRIAVRVKESKGTKESARANYYN